MQHRNPFPESGRKTGYGLISQGNLRNQHNRLPAQCCHSGNQFHIHLGLTASGNPVNQIGAGLSVPILRQYLPCNILLLPAQRDPVRFPKRTHRTAVHILRQYLHKPLLFQSTDHGRRHRKCFGGTFIGNLPFPAYSFQQSESGILMLSFQLFHTGMCFFAKNSRDNPPLCGRLYFLTYRQYGFQRSNHGRAILPSYPCCQPDLIALHQYPSGRNPQHFFDFIRRILRLICQLHYIAAPFCIPLAERNFHTHAHFNFSQQSVWYPVLKRPVHLLMRNIDNHIGIANRLRRTGIG